MSYCDFSLSKVAERFGLSVVEQVLYEDVAELAPSPALQPLLDCYQPLARAIGTEKARTESLIAPVLAEIRFHLDDQVSLFSGVDLNAAPDQGLNGVCDFLLSRSPQQLFLTRPVLAVVVAKNENLSTGYGQCIAEMVGARVFNEARQITEPVLFGVVTTGTAWRFLRWEGNLVALDRCESQLAPVASNLGFLATMLTVASYDHPGGGRDAMSTSKGSR